MKYSKKSQTLFFLLVDPNYNLKFISEKLKLPMKTIRTYKDYFKSRGYLDWYLHLRGTGNMQNILFYSICALEASCGFVIGWMLRGLVYWQLGVNVNLILKEGLTKFPDDITYTEYFHYYIDILE